MHYIMMNDRYKTATFCDKPEYVGFPYIVVDVVNVDPGKLTVMNTNPLSFSVPLLSVSTVDGVFVNDRYYHKTETKDVVISGKESTIMSVMFNNPEDGPHIIIDFINFKPEDITFGVHENVPYLDRLICAYNHDGDMSVAAKCLHVVLLRPLTSSSAFLTRCR